MTAVIRSAAVLVTAAALVSAAAALVRTRHIAVALGVLLDLLLAAGLLRLAADPHGADVAAAAALLAVKRIASYGIGRSAAAREPPAPVPPADRLTS